MLSKETFKLGSSLVCQLVFEFSHLPFENITDQSSFDYRMRAIITRGLYTFYPLFEVKKRFFKGNFS